MERGAREAGRGRAIAAGAALFALALGVRGLCAARTEAVAKDTYVFVRMGKALERGGFGALFRPDADGLPFVQHPLFPLAVAMVHRPGSEWIPAAQIASVAFGALAIVPLFAFLRRVAPPREALLGSALGAVHPSLVEYTIDGRSEGTYLFFVAAALWAAAEAFRLSPPRAAGEGEPSPPPAVASRGAAAAWALLAGILAAGAYWTRPEGLGVAVLALAWAGWDRLRRGQAPRPGPGRALPAAILALACLAAAFPYMHEIGDVTQKKPILRPILRRLGIAGAGGAVSPRRAAIVLGGPAVRPAAAAAGPGPRREGEDGGPKLSPLTLPGALGLLVWPLALLGLGIGVSRRVRDAPGGPDPGAEDFLWSVLLGYLLITQLLGIAAGYISGRHMVSMFPVCLAWAARGLFFLPVVVERALAGVGRPRRIPPRLGASFGAVLCLVFAARVLRPQRESRSAEREAGVWIRTTLGSERRVLSSSERPALYADAVFLDMVTRGPDPALEGRADAVVVADTDVLDGRKPARFPGLEEQLRKAGWRLANEFKGEASRKRDRERFERVYLRAAPPPAPRPAP